MGSIYNRGFQVSRDEKERQEKARENMGKRLYRFFLGKDGDEADIIFLTNEPINFNAHTEQKDGKYEEFTCSEDDTCPFCAQGVKKSYRGAFLIYDKRDFEVTDRNTQKKKVIHGSVKMYTPGVRVVSQLDRLNSRYGLAFRECNIARSGSSTSTTYMIERGDKVNLTESEIREMLPEKLRESFDGSEESLYRIVEDQVSMNIKGASQISVGESNDNYSEEDSADILPSAKILGMNPPEDPEPKKSLGGGSRLRRKLRRPAEDSRKSRKDIFRNKEV